MKSVTTKVYCDFLKDIPEIPDKDGNPTYENLCALFVAANTLQMESLIDLCTAKLCMLLRNMTINERRQFFVGEKFLDFEMTSEEQQKIETDNDEILEIYHLNDDNQWSVLQPKPKSFLLAFVKLILYHFNYKIF